MFKANKTRMGMRLAAVACAALLSVSLSGCDNGSTSGKSGTSTAEKKTVAVPTITKEQFKKLEGTKFGDVRVQVHELTDVEKKSVSSQVDSIKKLSEKAKPVECASLLQHQLAHADLNGLDNLIMAGGSDSQHHPHMVSLFTKPSEAQIKTYKEGEAGLLSKCPKITIEVPGKAMEFNMKPFDVSEYKDISESVLGLSISNGERVEHASIEAILKNADHQAVQVIAPTPEAAKKVMDDFIKAMHLRG